MGLVQNTNNVFPPKYENNTWSQGVIIGFPRMVAFIECYKCPLIILLRIPSLDFFLPFPLLLLSLPSFFPLPAVISWPPPLYQPLCWIWLDWDEQIPDLVLSWSLVRETGKQYQGNKTGTGTSGVVLLPPQKAEHIPHSSGKSQIHLKLQVDVKRGTSEGTFVYNIVNLSLITC